MKKALMWVLSLTLLVSLASCDTEIDASSDTTSVRVEDEADVEVITDEAEDITDENTTDKAVLDEDTSTASSDAEASDDTDTAAASEKA